MIKPDLLSLEQKVKPFIIKAGSIIAQNWHKKKTLTRIDRRDITTSVDVNIENTLRKQLHAIFPEAGFIVEEGLSDNNHIYNWVIDAIDGTKNFIADIPLFSCQIALVKGAEPIFGIIYNPISDYYLSAVKGHGTYLNGRKILAPVRVTLKDAMIDFDIGAPTLEKLQLIEKLIKDVFRIYITGGQYCAYIMSGAIDAYISLDERSKPVDLYPRIIIMREAGLSVQYFNLGFLIVLIAAHSNLMKEIVSILGLNKR